MATEPTKYPCPKCNALTDDKHCDVKDFPEASVKCPWWRCVLCKTTFRGRDGHILPPKPATS